MSASYVPSSRRAVEDVARHVRDAVGQPAAARQVGRRRVEVGLQLERRDVAAVGRRQPPRRAADAGADVEHARRRVDAEPRGGQVDRLGAVVVVLVERHQLLDRQRRVVRDTERAQLVVDPLDAVVELHALRRLHDRPSVREPYGPPELARPAGRRRSRRSASPAGVSRVSGRFALITQCDAWRW